MQEVARAIAMRLLSARGATAVEHALLIALIAIAIAGTTYALGASVSFVFDGAADSLATPGPAPPPAAPPPSPAAPGSVAPPGVGYEDCDAVRAAGADPIHVGDPGYSPELDPDGDGVACE